MADTDSTYEIQQQDLRRIIANHPDNNSPTKCLACVANNSRMAIDLKHTCGIGSGTNPSSKEVELALKECPFCGASAFISWDGDVNNPDDWSANCDNTLDCGATVGGMSSEDAARKAWNIRADSAAAMVDTSKLADWLDMLVTSLKASEKYDYHEWGQFIIGAENWANKLRAVVPGDEAGDGLIGKIRRIANLGSAVEFGDADERLRAIHDLINVTKM